jgi:Flp pilus assembly pilin Flp
MSTCGQERHLQQTQKFKTGDTKMATKLSNVFRKFHSDEEGLEALQVVMIIAIAAVILVAAGTVGQSVVDFTKTKLNALKDKQVNG